MKLVLSLCALSLIVVDVTFADQHEQTLLEYGAQCAREIGEIPPFDCNSGTDIPITIDERMPGPNEKPKRCDRPSLLHPEKESGTECVPYSKVLNLSRGDTQISVYCRRDAWRRDRSPYYDGVNVILHHAGNGKTCWFTSREPPRPARAGVKGSCGPANCKDPGLDATRVPPPDEKTPPPGQLSAVEFWQTPSVVAGAKPNCISCHDAGPYIYSPYIGQVWSKVPTDPWGKYSSIGPAFERGPQLSLSTPGNTCIGCHRIGSEKSCEYFLPFSAGRRSLDRKLPPGNNALANRYPLNHWMPTNNNMSQAEWDATNKHSIDAILSCCKEKSNPNCILTPIATGDGTSKNRAP
ncbi:hypothetical protein M3A49_32860 [Paraburkholderia sp. CNPSo 3076]|uniref:hypothetical protein n=1 Tax=Paraburkholderia sp. CNPSo 3076 TaxID=2940936 RepID=UPI00225B3EC5|nr:hypothetical protein [Paraburkholderia sp. CNPSo 3076]MCX5544208.1 hypothetical protein [Paraburkholderia sp. CNPSo 3076]